MTVSIPRGEGPPSILLASDLSGRCDRALDRACDLAEAWGATLQVVTAIEPGRPQPGWRASIAAAKAEARAEVAETVGWRSIAWDVTAVEGAAEAVVIDVAQSLDPDLIVVGMARNELLGRSNPGRTVEALIRRARTPVLVVKRRASRPYRRVLVPTDFSAAAETAVVWAASRFPQAEFSLLHGYRAPFAGFLDEEALNRDLRTLALKDQRAFVARVRARAPGQPKLTAKVAAGDPDDLVVGPTAGDGADLMVVGAHDRRGVFGRLEPDVAGRLLMAASCDTLVVPEAVGEDLVAGRSTASA